MGSVHSTSMAIARQTAVAAVAGVPERRCTASNDSGTQGALDYYSAHLRHLVTGAAVDWLRDVLGAAVLHGGSEHGADSNVDMHAGGPERISRTRDRLPAPHVTGSPPTDWKHAEVHGAHSCRTPRTAGMR